MEQSILSFCCSPCQVISHYLSLYSPMVILPLETSPSHSVWTLLNESLWSCYQCSQHSAREYSWAKHCSGALREGDSASQQLLLRWIPAFSYNYTQRWAVRTTPTHGLGHSWFFRREEGIHLSPATIFQARYCSPHKSSAACCMLNITAITQWKYKECSQGWGSCLQWNGVIRIDWGTAGLSQSSINDYSLPTHTNDKIWKKM